jgi:hypothetical protein
MAEATRRVVADHDFRQRLVETSLEWVTHRTTEGEVRRLAEFLVG